jgi:hypothetical protein
MVKLVRVSILIPGVVGVRILFFFAILYQPITISLFPLFPLFLFTRLVPTMSL